MTKIATITGVGDVTSPPLASADHAVKPERAEHGAPAPRAGEATAGVAEAGSGAEGAALGSTQSNYVGQTFEQRRRDRWLARAALWDASTLWPVRTCGYLLRPLRPGEGINNDSDPMERPDVEVRRRHIDGRPVAGYGGLMTCGSAWACPRCAGVIAFQRSGEIANAVEECHRRGGQVHFLTLTLRHRRTDSLADLWRILQDGAWKKTFGAHAWTGLAGRKRTGKGRSWVEPTVLGDRERFGVAGLVRVIEATVSPPDRPGHGWHLHMHVLLFTAGALTAGLRSSWRDHLARMGVSRAQVDELDGEWVARCALTARIADRWCRGVRGVGGRAPGESAVDLRRVHDGGEEYVGRYLAKSTYDVATRLGAELAAGSLTKETRNLSPFEVLTRAVKEERFAFATPKQWTIRRAPDGVGWHAVHLVRADGSVIVRTPPGDAERGDWRVEYLDGRWVFVWGDVALPDELIVTEEGQVVDGVTGELLDAWQVDHDELKPPPLWSLWLEWEQASRGRHAILWSQEVRMTDGKSFKLSEGEPVPRKGACNTSAVQALDRLWMEILTARGCTADESNEEVARVELHGDVVAHIERADWFRLVRQPGRIVEVLEEVEA